RPKAARRRPRRSRGRRSLTRGSRVYLSKNREGAVPQTKRGRRAAPTSLFGGAVGWDGIQPGGERLRLPVARPGGPRYGVGPGGSPDPTPLDLQNGRSSPSSSPEKASSLRAPE